MRFFPRAARLAQQALSETAAALLNEKKAENRRKKSGKPPKKTRENARLCGQKKRGNVAPSHAGCKAESARCKSLFFRRKNLVARCGGKLIGKFALIAVHIHGADAVIIGCKIVQPAVLVTAYAKLRIRLNVGNKGLFVGNESRTLRAVYFIVR